MKICPDCGLEKDKTDFARSSPRCRPCAEKRRKRQLKEASDRYISRHPDRIADRNKRNYAADPERAKSRAQKWRAENPERAKATAKAWQEVNADRFAEMHQAWVDANPDYYSRWRRENPELGRLYLANRRAAEKQAMPVWANSDKILAFYAEAVRLTRETGIPHHVDHIYPLQSDWVCGLHVETNLQVLPAVLNQSKGNRPPKPDSQPRCCAWPSIVHFEASRGARLC